MTRYRDPTREEFLEFVQDTVEDEDTEAVLVAALGPDGAGLAEKTGAEDLEDHVALAGIALRRAYSLSGSDDAEAFLRAVVSEFNDRSGELGVDK